MKVEVLKVAGLDIACDAVRLSFNSTSNEDTVIASGNDRTCMDLFADDVELLKKLIVAGDSHAKVMRMATVWLDVTMPRYWWSEADQCKVGFVTMSESSVHRLKSRIKKGELGVPDFEVDKYSVFATYIVEQTISAMFAGVTKCDISTEELKQMLPESFLQRRIICTNYQTLRHIYFDRRKHRLPIWHKFLDTLLEQLPFPEFITVEKEVISG